MCSKNPKIQKSKVSWEIVRRTLDFWIFGLEKHIQKDKYLQDYCEIRKKHKKVQKVQKLQKVQNMQNVQQKRTISQDALDVWIFGFWAFFAFGMLI